MTKWKIDDSYDTILMISDEDGNPICDVSCEYDSYFCVIAPNPQEVRNAELIRSAPELKECLQDLCKAYRKIGGFSVPLVQAERLLKKLSETEL